MTAVACLCSAQIAYWEWEHDGVVRRELDYLVEVEGDLATLRLEAGKHDAYAWVWVENLDLLLDGRTDGDFRLRDIVATALKAKEEAAMDVPGLGNVTKDDRFGWYYSDPIPVPMFGGMQCRIVLEGYDEDLNKDEFHVAIRNFLSGTPVVLREAEQDLFRYYEDFKEYWEEDGRQPIKSPEDVWQHVRLGNEPMVTRRPYGDKGIYISVECGCDWEEEHGLQIVLKNGLKVNKLGPYDGHLTNSDAYADDSLEHVVYR